MTPCWDHDRRTIDFGAEGIVELAPEDFERLRIFVVWAVGQFPKALVEKIPRLALRNEIEVREIADEIVDAGYPYTALEIRTYWRPT